MGLGRLADTDAVATAAAGAAAAHGITADDDDGLLLRFIAVVLCSNRKEWLESTLSRMLARWSFEK